MPYAIVCTTCLWTSSAHDHAALSHAASAHACGDPLPHQRHTADRAAQATAERRRAVEERVLAVVEATGAAGVSRSFLTRKTQTVTLAEREAAITELERRGALVQREERGARGGPAMVLYSTAVAPAPTLLSVIHAAGPSGVSGPALKARFADVPREEFKAMLLGLLQEGVVLHGMGLEDGKPVERFRSAKALQEATPEEQAAVAESDAKARQARVEKAG